MADQFLFVDSDMTSRTGSTISDEEREAVDQGNLDVYRYSSNFLRFERLVVDGPHYEEDDEDETGETSWGEDQWQPIKP